MDAATCTANRLTYTLSAMFVMYVTAFILAPVFWLPTLFCLLTVFMGLAAARKRNARLLKFYSILQSLILSLTVISAVLALVFYYQNKEEVEKWWRANNFLTPRQLYIVEICFFLIFSLDLMLRIRSIVLARILHKQLTVLPYLEEQELQNLAIQTEQQPEAVETVQPVYILPQPAFAAQQAQMTTPYALPTNYVPIYVDSQGNPILQTNFHLTQN
eukprot:TRINITY_DN1092_c0_g1_i1.p1 TRINITY_DN1092_c0_g1~~TRINITY_DN1092_c0_g1_i1.p1  ORF type:complete len:232 (-),score=43.22 TRINITY_DN1092_c0_g1_i1:43-690(-)